MSCVGFDPHVDPWPPGIERADLGSILARADFVSIHVPLTPETRGLIGRREVTTMKRGVVVVNTSRGDVIDETAFLAALDEGRIAAAGLDVLSGEPDVKDHRLVAYAKMHDNVIITPHIAGFSPDALREVLDFSCSRIVAFFESDARRTA
jgi:phosphoglycerate dehydrogenase-like enzyme